MEYILFDSSHSVVRDGFEHPADAEAYLVELLGELYDELYDSYYIQDWNGHGVW